MRTACASAAAAAGCRAVRSCALRTRASRVCAAAALLAPRAPRRSALVARRAPRRSPEVPCPPVCSARRSGPSLATRLSRIASTLPQRVDLYFERRPIRRFLWCGISGFAGFYVANTVSLSFGALAVNDIVAAALAVTFVELVTRAFYTAWPNPPFSLWLLHCFKLGFVYALISDSFKLGG